MRRWPTPAAVVLAVLISLGMARDSGADEFYYALVFGSQSQPRLAKYTHTWVTFVRAVGEGPDASRYASQPHTISWLPASLVIRPLRLEPEPGVNMTLEETLAFAFRNGERVRMWGPFRIDRETYNDSVREFNILQSGRRLYRAISFQDDPVVCDCIHAVEKVDPLFGTSRYPLIRLGHPASRFMARVVMVNTPFDQTATDHTWLVPRLGLDRYPIEHVPPPSIPDRKCELCRCPEHAARVHVEGR